MIHFLFHKYARRRTGPCTLIKVGLYCDSDDVSDIGVWLTTRGNDHAGRFGIDLMLHHARNQGHRERWHRPEPLVTS